MPLVALDPRIRRVVPVAFRRWRNAPLSAQRAQRVRRISPRVARASDTTRSSISRSSSRAPSSRAWRGERATASTARTCASPSRPGSTTCTTRSTATSTSSRRRARWPRRALGLHGRRGRRAGSSRRRPAAAATPDRSVCHRVPRDEPRGQAVARARTGPRLLAHFAQAGLRVLLPVGQRRRASSAASGSRAHATNAIVPPRQTLPELASLARSRGGRGGRRHGPHAPRGRARHADRRDLHDHRRNARRRCAPPARTRVDIGGNGRVPSLGDAIETAGRVLRDTPRC